MSTSPSAAAPAKPSTTSTANDAANNDDDNPLTFTPEEEASRLLESQTHKETANAKFASGDYSDAISTYEQALACCPKYLSYERAVLKANIAACHIKTEAWQDAVKAASGAVDLLDECDPDPEAVKRRKKAERKRKREARNGKERVKGKGLKVERVGEGFSSDDEEEESKDAGNGKVESDEEEEEEAEEEIITPGATKAEDTSALGKRKTEISRLRIKALLRRAKARTEIGSWSSLVGAEEDYKTLSAMPVGVLSSLDRQTVQRQLVLLPAKTKAAQDREMADMMGKLKGLGNSILKPFGLSTDNFQMVKDEKSGGYSMNFSS